jgi:hypothetical protein
MPTLTELADWPSAARVPLGCALADAPTKPAARTTDVAATASLAQRLRCIWTLPS